MTRTTFWGCFLACVFGFASGCSLTRWGVDRASVILETAAHAFREEPDVAFAREAWAGNVKLIEGLLKTSPNNPRLLRQAAEALCGYAFLFVEDEMDSLPLGDEARQLHARRASRFYERCGRMALRLLEQRHPDMGRIFVMGAPEAFEAALQNCTKEDVAGLFFFAFSLGGQAHLNREDVALIANVWRIESLFRRVLELDRSFFHGGAHAALGVLFTSRSPMLGGNPEKGREEFERAIALTEGKYLMHRVLLARNYAVAVGDRALFERELEAVVAASENLFPRERLANEIARRRAARYLELAEEFF